MYRGETFTRKRDAESWAKQVEVQEEHIVASGYQPVPEGYSVADLIDGYALECNMGGRTKQATHAIHGCSQHATLPYLGPNNRATPQGIKRLVDALAWMSYMLITEGDSTEMRFNGRAIATQLADGIRDANLQLTSPELKIWLYLTHGIKVVVEPDPRLSAEIISHINAIAT